MCVTRSSAGWWVRGAESVFLCIAPIKGQSDTRALTHVHCYIPIPNWHSTLLVSS